MMNFQNTETLEPDDMLARLFTAARSQNGWRDQPVEAQLLLKIHDLARMGPTSMNCAPLRVQFLTSPAAKERLRPALAAGNVEKMMSCPVVAVFATDHDFPIHLSFLFPHTDGKAFFDKNPGLVDETAFRNATLQAAYYMLAARAVGLDCAPISGFNAAAVEAEFLTGTRRRVNFLCGIGYGEPSKLFPRHPRFAFDQVCQIL